jgi:hypothetical protein
MEWTDEELEREALAADPDVEVADDAVSVWDILGEQRQGLLPSWYMPAAAPREGARWQKLAVGVLIGACLAVPAVGLCNTFGWFTIA